MAWWVGERDRVGCYDGYLFSGMHIRILEGRNEGISEDVVRHA